MGWREYVLLATTLSMFLVNAALLANEKVTRAPGEDVESPRVQTATDTDTEGTE